MGPVSGGATTGSGATGTNSRFSSQKQGTSSTEEAEKLNEKLRILRDENTKLKELLKRNEAMIESKLSESKLEQQHVMTICNLMGPIIHALNTGTQKTPPPRSFQELIGQLDDLNRQIKSGSLMTATSIQQLKTDLQ